MDRPIDDYLGKRMTLDRGKSEHCDSCTDEITGEYIRVAVGFIYCLECGHERRLMSRDELIRENLNLQMRLDYAKQELDKLKAFNPMTLENLLDWREHE